ncbi:rhomboid family intramembrane serine protease [Histidinibacterium aquaticum]|uniref:Rhomboid family intramembrane serine protease n=1 Tax=Histidinibacterium aquaticum TaxID=2613962 RepID=A0A5J5GIC5_9RHOB|nr:rhomboid family intramembrane serine protease [Histidinibacterium aquaticum]KAA9007790.1 rhomboid family intramembrane serine protease [Histidinibacterium aquaticum]
MDRDQTSSSRDDSHQDGAPAFLWGLVGIMAVIELTLTAADAGMIGTPRWRWLAYGYGAFWQPLLSGELSPSFPGQVYSMFVTHAFLHGGLLHLLMNSVVILALGKMIAGRIGAGRTLLILLLAAIGGGVAFGMIATSTTPMIGASGAVFGLLGVWQAWDYRIRRRLQMPVRPLLSGIAALILVNALLYLYLQGGLAWEAHLGGWLVGVIAAATFARADMIATHRSGEPGD